MQVRFVIYFTMRSFLPVYIAIKYQRKIKIQ